MGGKREDEEGLIAVGEDTAGDGEESVVTVSWEDTPPVPAAGIDIFIVSSHSRLQRSWSLHVYSASIR